MHKSLLVLGLCLGLVDGERSAGFGAFDLGRVGGW
jgi:hypothetical protein